MADYSQVNDYSAKDALSTGNPLKLIKGSDVDAEFSAISTAIASKFDSTDIATAGEAQAGVSNTVVITPARLTAWAQNGAGVVEDLQALADPNDDQIVFWDDSAGAAAFLDLGTGLSITGTTLTANGISGVSITAGNGLSGGGELTATRNLDLDYNELTAATPVSGDEFSFGDISDSNTVKKVTLANLEAALTISNLGGYDANDAVDHTTITLTAGEGLTGGGDISASRTFDLDISGLTEETSLDAVNDDIVFYDASASAHRKVPIDSLIGTELGDGKWYKSTTTSLTTTEQTIVYNTADNDSLNLGTFDTAAGTYTATGSARILVTATQVVPSLASGEASLLRIQKDGVDQAYVSTRRNTAGDNVDTATTIVNMTAGQVLRTRGGMEAGTGTANSGISGQHISIVELG